MTTQFSSNLCIGLFDNLMDDNINSHSVKAEYFSFFDQPESTTETLKVCANGLATQVPINITTPFCYDPAPFVLLEALITGSSNQQPNISFSSNSVEKVIQSLRLPKLMSCCEVSDKEDVWPFPIKYGRAYKRNYDSEIIDNEIYKAVMGYVETLDSWLGAHGFSMKSQFKVQMEDQLFELLGNADHAYNGNCTDDGGDWAICGFMVARNNEKTKEKEHICHISVITLGQTIQETLENPPNEFVAERIKAYANHAETHTLLSREALVTAVATHDDISCAEIGGGNGLTDFLSTFPNVAASLDKERNAVVISGCGHVRFKDKYASLIETARNSQRQPFNDYFSTDFPPDTNYVYHNDNRISGTVIGVRFNLDEENLAKKANGS